MKKRIDEPTGTQTVGHEWDGIEELDTPLPRWWLMIFAACVAFAIGYVIFFPAIPLANSATRGLNGWTSRGEFDKALTAEQARRAPIYRAIAATPVENLPNDPKLLQRCHRGRQGGLQGALRAMPWLGRGRLGRLSQPQRR